MYGVVTIITKIAKITTKSLTLKLQLYIIIHRIGLEGDMSGRKRDFTGCDKKVTKVLSISWRADRKWGRENFFQ